MTSFYIPKRAALLLGALFALNPISMLLASESGQSSDATLDAASDTDIERLSIHYRQAYRGNVSST